MTGTRKYDHITPVLCDLHWLPVQHRIDFKVAMTVYKCIHGLVPQYLADDCVLASTVRSRRHLRSADSGDIFMTRSFSVTPKTTEQHLIARSDKSVAYVTNNKDSVRRFVLLKLTTDRHEASRGLFATAELLV